MDNSPTSSRSWFDTLTGAPEPAGPSRDDLHHHVLGADRSDSNVSTVGTSVSPPAEAPQPSPAGVRMLRSVHAAVPRSWRPLARRGFARVSAGLPPGLRSRLYRLVEVLRPDMGTIEENYAAWIDRHDRIDDTARRRILSRIAGFGEPPVISVVMPVYNPKPSDLAAAIRSVRNQLYPFWQLCIADDASTDPAVASVLRTAAAKDSRIEVVWRDSNGHISAASNAALTIAKGAFVALLDHDDELSPRALYEVASALADVPDADILFSDEDHIDARGRRSQPYFKPGWNPQLMLGQNLISHLGVYRRALLHRIGGFRIGFEGSQDHDLALRAVAETTDRRIVHIPKVLYHWRQHATQRTFSESALDRCALNGRRAVQEFLARLVPGTRIEPAPGLPIWHRIIYPVPRPEPLVSVIIPTRDQEPLLRRTLQGVLSRTDYPALEVLVVDNGSTDPAALALLADVVRDPRVRVLPASGPFNYSALNNAAVREAAGSIVLLLNNDVDVIDAGWMREMVSHAVRSETGAVGAKLLYPNGTIQHGGVVTGLGGVAGHMFLGKPRTHPGYFGQLALARNVTAVTGACLMVRRHLFQQVGGLNDVDLPVAFNDIDFCLKLTEAGYGNIWTPFAELYHLESVSRGSDETPEKAARFSREVAYMRQRWGYRLDFDPHWNPNLSLRATDMALAFPPRVADPPVVPAYQAA